MYDPPAYVWALTIAGPAAIAAATCIALYGGAAGESRRRPRPARTAPLYSAMQVAAAIAVGLPMVSTHT